MRARKRYDSKRFRVELEVQPTSIKSNVASPVGARQDRTEKADEHPQKTIQKDKGSPLAEVRGIMTTDIYSPTGRELQQRNRLNEHMLISPSDSRGGNRGAHPPSIYKMREKGVAS